MSFDAKKRVELGSTGVETLDEIMPDINLIGENELEEKLGTSLDNWSPFSLA